VCGTVLDSGQYFPRCFYFFVLFSFQGWYGLASRSQVLGRLFVLWDRTKPTKANHPSVSLDERGTSLSSKYPYAYCIPIISTSLSPSNT